MKLLRWTVTILMVTLFLTIGAYKLWDFVETRRLAASVEKVKAADKPVPLQERVAGLQGDAANADRYIRAAAALASASGRWFPRSTGALAEAIRARTLTPEMVAELRMLVAEEPFAMALQLLDKATALPFNGLVSSNGGGGQVISDLMQLKELADERTTLLAYDANADAAAASLVSSFRVLRVMKSTLALGASWRFTVDGAGRTAFVLERTQPTPGALKRLATTVAELDADTDDNLKRYYTAIRAQSIPGAFGPGQRALQALIARNPNPGVLAWVLSGPLGTRRLRERIDEMSSMIDAMALPWPSRIDEVVRLTGVESLKVAGTVAEAGAALAVTRCAAVVIAIEEYRRDHGGVVPDRLDALTPDYLPTVPLDPFSGRSLKYTPESSKYSVYSVWLDRTDDHNVLTPSEYARPGNSYLQSAQDFGLVMPIVQTQRRVD
jgi:hypothetical protein